MEIVADLTEHLPLRMSVTKVARDAFQMAEGTTAQVGSPQPHGTRWSTRCQSIRSSEGLVAEALVRTVILSGVCDRLAEVLICVGPLRLLPHQRVANALVRTSKLMFKKLTSILDHASGSMSDIRYVPDGC